MLRYEELSSPDRAPSPEVVHALGTPGPLPVDDVSRPAPRTQFPFTLDVVRGPPSLGVADTSAELTWQGHFAWEKYGRRNIKREDVLAIRSPKPDVYRFTQVARELEDGGMARFMDWVGRGTWFVVPDGLPSDVTFVRTKAEVEYLDRAARWLFLLPLPTNSDDYTTPVFAVDEFRRYPYAYHDSAAARSRWKVAATIRRVEDVVLGEYDWVIGRGPGTKNDRVTGRDRLWGTLSRNSFPVVPDVLRNADVNRGLVVAVPPVVRFFGLAHERSGSGLLQRMRYKRWAETEWALYVGEAMWHQMMSHNRFWTLTRECTEALSPLWSTFFELTPAIRPHVGVAERFRPIDFEHLLRMVVASQNVAPSWIASRNDYATGDVTAWIGYDRETGTLFPAKSVGESYRMRDVGRHAAPGWRERRETSGSSSAGGSALSGMLTAHDVHSLSIVNQALGDDFAKRENVLVGPLIAELASQVITLRIDRDAQRLRGNAADASQQRVTELEGQLRTTNETLCRVRGERDRYRVLATHCERAHQSRGRQPDSYSGGLYGAPQSSYRTPDDNGRNARGAPGSATGGRPDPYADDHGYP